MKKIDKILDSWLVLNYQSGHKKSFAILVKRWHHRFCRQAYYYTKDMDLAKDIVQESWQVILKKIYTLEDSNKFGSWGFSIVTRKSIDWLRKEKRNASNLKEYFESEKIITEVIPQNLDEIQKLKRAIKNISIDQQIVIRLFYIEGYSLYEISEILNISKGTVKSRLYYAREKLKSIIKTRNNEK